MVPSKFVAAGCKFLNSPAGRKLIKDGLIFIGPHLGPIAIGAGTLLAVAWVIDKVTD